MKAKLKSFGISDIGLNRANNEDVCLSLPEIGFFALADGMGGHQAGEIAAKEAIEFLSRSIQTIKSRDLMELIIELKAAIEQTNQWVYQLGKTNEFLHGMGTTLCCMIWTDEGVVYGHVGDSRVYRFRNQKLEPLTQDHSLLAKWLSYGKLAEECETPFPYKNVITKAIGTSSRAEPEIAVSTFEPGDLFFLCSDGLTDALSCEEMEKILHHSPDLETATKVLIQKAKIKGSSDNITLLMVESETESGESIFRQQCDNSLGPAGLPGDVSRSERPSSQSL